MLPSDISITANITSSLQQYFQSRKFSNIVVLVDGNTKKNCLPVIGESIPSHHLIEIESGEKHKTLDTCNRIWSDMTDLDLDRHALLINLGGGVIGDMGGFCAATYKRGIDFINIPTTLLAQVDASVGGKLGVDFKGLKNHIGVFRLPSQVFLHSQFLKTLPFRQLRSGFAEVIKHGLIADVNYWNQIQLRELKDQNWKELVEHSVRIKSRVVKSDPMETGLRKILNFGHTIGHAIETYCLTHWGEETVLHGEAIAAGMICESYLSEKLLNLPSEQVQKIENYISANFSKIDLQRNDFPGILDLIKQDKKNKGGIVNFSLLEKIGKCMYNVPVEGTLVEQALKRYIDL